MKRKKWILLVCLAILQGCAQAPLQKPVAGEAFAQETQPAEPLPEEGVIPSETSKITSTAAPSSPDPAQISESPITPPEQITESLAITDLPAYTHPPFISASELDTSGLSNEKLGWYFIKNNEHLPSHGAAEIDISAYNGCYLGDTSQKYIWLTFNCGFENGNTPLILDTLKEKNVPAAFFVLGTYIRDNPELTKRMAEEGHLVVNHSDTHLSMPGISDQEILDEIFGCAKRYKELTGMDMPPFFRPASGEYCERALYITKEAGYKTVFWSFAYLDWLVDEQPGKDYTFKIVMDNLHNGQILMLHPVSTSNTEALPDIIDAVKAQGFEFRILYDLP